MEAEEGSAPEGVRHSPSWSPPPPHPPSPPGPALTEHNLIRACSGLLLSQGPPEPQLALITPHQHTPQPWKRVCCLVWKIPESQALLGSVYLSETPRAMSEEQETEVLPPTTLGQQCFQWPPRQSLEGAAEWRDVASVGVWLCDLRQGSRCPWGPFSQTPWGSETQVSGKESSAAPPGLGPLRPAGRAPPATSL